MNSFASTLERIKKVTDIHNQADLASCLGVTRVAVSNAKKRGVFPPKWLFKIAFCHSLDLDYLANGSPDEIIEEKKIPLRKVTGSTFSERLRSARRRFGSMQKLADAVETSRQTIQTWETNAPKNTDRVLLQKVADVLEVPVRQLLFGAEVRPEDINGRVANTKIGERLQFQRVSADLTHHALAEKTGLRPGQIMRFESGDVMPTIDQLNLMAGHLKEGALTAIIDNSIEIPENQRGRGNEDVQAEIDQLKSRIKHLESIKKGK